VEELAGGADELENVEALAQLALPDRGHASLRDRLVDLAMSGAALDRDGLATILAADGAAGGKAPGSAMGFSFTRRDSDPGRARSDLAAAVEIIAAADEVEKALGQATERLKRDFTDEAYREQQRLIEARQGLKDRLASLASSD
jgi:DNA primase